MDITLLPNRVFLAVDAQKKVAVNLLISNIAILVAIIVLARCDWLLETIPHQCIFKRIAGFPCPGCGITTAFLFFGRSEWAAAYGANPAAFPVALSIGVDLVFAIAIISGNYSENYNYARAILQRVAIFSLLFIWILRVVTPK